MNALRTLYRYWIALVFVAVIAQIAGAAYGAFYSADKLMSQKGPDEHRLISEKVFDHGFGFHTGFGYLIFLGSLILLLLALGARLGKRRVLFALAVPVAVAIQIVLAWASEDTHAIGPLHGLWALVILGLTGSMAAAAWRGGAAHAGTAQATPVA